MHLRKFVSILLLIGVLLAAPRLCGTASLPLAADTGKIKKETPETAFQTACHLYREDADKTASIQVLKRFLKRYRKKPRAADAQFLIGEAFMKKALKLLESEADASLAASSFKRAEKAFRRVIKKYKKSGLVSSAQYRIGEIFYNRGKWEEAASTFKKIDHDWPKSYLVPESLLGIIFANLAMEKFKEAEDHRLILATGYPQYLSKPAVLYASGILALYNSKYEDAEDAFTRIKTPEAKFYLGKTYLEAGKPIKAANTFASLMTKYPDSELREEAEFLIGDALFISRDFDTAISKYRDFMRKYPYSRFRVSALYRIGISQFQKESYGEARLTFGLILQRHPRDFFAALAQYFIAQSYQVNMQWKEALFSYSRIVSQYPSSPVHAAAHYLLAWCQHAVNDIPQAVQTCRTFLERYSAHDLAQNVYFLMGNCLVETKRYPQAFAAYQKALDIQHNPGQPEIAAQALFMMIKTRFELKDYDPIVTSYQYILGSKPPSETKWSALSYLYIADAYMALSLTNEARNLYSKILDVYPESPAAVYAQDGLAWSYALEGQDSLALKARRDLKEMIATSTAAVVSHNQLGLGDILFNQGDYEGAYSLYQQFSRKNPDSPRAPVTLSRAALSLYNARYYTQAIETWELLQTKYPNSPQAMEAAYKVADTYFRAQKYPDAIRKYRNFISLYSGDPRACESNLRIIQAYYNSGQTVMALEAAQDFCGAYPDASEAIESLDLVESILEEMPQSDPRAVLGRIVKENAKTPVAAQALFRLGVILLDKKDYAGAVKNFKRFNDEFTAHPLLVRAQYLLAEAHYQAGQFAQAIPVYERFLDASEKTDEFLPALFHLGNCYYNLQQYVRSAGVYERLVKDYPESEFTRAAFFNSILCFKAADDIERAQAAYNRYTKDVPPQTESVANLWSFFEIFSGGKKYEQALKILEQIESRPSGGEGKVSLQEVLFHKAEIYRGLKREKDMVKTWLQLRSMKPFSNPFRLQALIQMAEWNEEKSDWKEAVAIYDDISRNSQNPDVGKAASGRAEALRGK